MFFRILIIAAILPLASCECGSPSTLKETVSLCAEATNHISDIIEKSGPPSEGLEKGVMAEARKASRENCDAEGISQEQHDCIMKVKTPDDFMSLGECAAIKEKRPSWLVLP